MPAHALLGFWLLAAALIAVPGPDWAFTLGVALESRLVVPAVAGLAAGYAGLTALVATGVGALVAGTPAALTVLTVAGGVYLVVLGVRTLRDAGATHPAAIRRAPETPRATFARGLGVSGLNPKGLLVFGALLPQFADRGNAWPLALQLAALGAVFTGTCAVFYLCLGSAAGAVASARPAAAHATTRIAGVAMVAIGVALLVERVGS
jgi:threonine/homoserine/homoserine lactone efflux protein